MNKLGIPLLLDKYSRFHNYLRISLTERCNFNCVYCVYDQEIEYTPPEKCFTHDELIHITKLFIKAGVSKIRLTGGEPTIYKRLSHFIEEIGSTPGIKKLGMTTNGFMLYKKLDEYQKNGLNILNVSLDTFNSEKAEKILDLTGAGDLFAAGFLKEYIDSSDIKKCLQTGSVLASKIIQKFGARL